MVRYRIVIASLATSYAALATAGEVGEVRARLRGLAGESVLLKTPNRPLAPTIAAGRLLSDACRQRAYAMARGPIQSAAATVPFQRAALDCFLEEFSGLFPNWPGPDHLRVIASRAGGIPGESQLEIRQFHGDLPVKPGNVKAYFVNGELVHVTGAFSPTPGAPETLAPAAQILPLAEANAGGRLEVIETYFDGAIGRPVLRATQRAADALSSEIVTLDRITGEIIAREPAGHPLSRQVPQSPWVRAYERSFMPPQTQTQRTVTAWCDESWPGPGTCSVPRSGICRYYLSRGVNNTGHVFATRFLWSSIAPQYPDGVDVYVDASCGTTNNWPRLDSGQYSAFAANAYAYLSELADIKNHWASFFAVYPPPSPPPGAPTPQLTLRVQDFSPDPVRSPAAVYEPSSDTMILVQDQHPLPTGNRHAEHLGTIAHEYGHYIHDQYGMGGTPALIEGWADTNVLRYALHQVVSTGSWNIGYSTELLPLQSHFHGQYTINGEFRVANIRNTVHFPDAFFPSPACSTDPPDLYRCGKVLSLIYWELVWDRCRSAYYKCSTNEQIVQSGSYAGNAWMLANSAFAYALFMSTDNPDIDDFMWDVEARYYAFFQSSYLDAYSYHRVLSVTGHHCLGQRGSCGLYHLPGSPHPNAWSLKEKYTEAEEYATQNCEPSCAVVYDEDASGLAHRPICTDPDPNKYIRSKLVLNLAGTYRVKVLLGWGPGSITMFRRNNGGWLTASVPASGHYDWRDAGTLPMVVGQNTIDLRVASGCAKLDGLRVEYVGP